jgi:hypothetical protein
MANLSSGAAIPRTGGGEVVADVCSPAIGGAWRVPIGKLCER